MVWWILSFPSAVGVSLIMMGYTNLNFLSPLTSINVGGIITLLSIWAGYRYWLSMRYREIFIYLRDLYDNVGLFVKQYYESERSDNNQKSNCLHAKMEEYVQLLSRYEQALSNKHLAEINNFFDKLFDYKRRIEGAVSYNRDETVYRRWLEINTDFNAHVTPVMKKLKKILG